MYASNYEEIVKDECSYLSPDDFSDEVYAKAWKRFMDGESMMTVLLELDHDVAFSSFDYPYTQSGPTEFSDKIKEFAYLRDSYLVAQKIAVAIGEMNTAEVRKLATDLSNKNITKGTVAFDGDQVDLAFRTLVDGGSVAVKTYLPQFDNAIGGLFQQELVVIAARPGMGKTSFVLNVARNVAFSGKKVLFFSLEMSKEQLWARMACPNAGLQWKDVRMGNITSADKQRLDLESVALASRLGKTLLIQDEVFTIGEIHQISVQLKPDLIIIDQLPDVQWHDPSVSEVIWYGQAVKFFRQFLAKGLKCPVVVVHQLSRAVEERTDKRPQLSDLRWSGEIEQRSDVVLMCYRDDYYIGRPPGVNVVNYEVWVKKNRQGEMSSCIVLNYDLKKQEFF